MKYLMKTDGGCAKVGRLAEDCGEFVFTPEREYPSVEEAENDLWERGEKYRIAEEVHTVAPKFTVDLARIADKARADRDDAAKAAGITVCTRAHYYHTNWECYTSDYGSPFEYEGDTGAQNVKANEFWNVQNYLQGLARAAWELGFSLCYDPEEKRHRIAGNHSKIVVYPARGY